MADAMEKAQFSTLCSTVYNALICFNVLCILQSLQSYNLFLSNAIITFKSSLYYSCLTISIVFVGAMQISVIDPMK